MHIPPSSQQPLLKLNERSGQSFAQGRYTLQRLLGQGGMGVVYEAIQQHPMSRRVAVKLIPAIEDQVIQRFEREASTVSRLHHPNTITVFDYGSTESGELFLAMEYLEGQSLKALIEREAPLPLARAVHIVSQITHALTEAHDLGIVHRDIKPDNIFLVTLNQDPDFVKVLDFGIAKAIHGELSADLTTDGRIVGTPKYMAPEQIMSQPADRRADIYSLGCVLYEMLCGEPPFGGSAALLMVGHTRKERPPLVNRERLKIEPSQIDALDRVIQRAMAVEPELRYASMRTFREDLIATATNTPIRRVTASFQAIALPEQSQEDAPTIARPRPQWTPPHGWPPSSQSAYSSSELVPGAVHQSSHQVPVGLSEQPSEPTQALSMQDVELVETLAAQPAEQPAAPAQMWPYWALLGVASLAFVFALFKIFAGGDAPAQPDPAPAPPDPKIQAMADARILSEAQRAVEVGYADKAIALCSPLLERGGQVEACERVLGLAWSQKHDAAKACPYLLRGRSRQPQDAALAEASSKLACVEQ